MLFKTVLLLSIFLAAGKCTIYPSKGKKTNIKSGPVDSSVHDRDLVSENPSAKDILNNYQAYYQDTLKRTSTGIVLGYVTPVRRFSLVSNYF